MPTYFSVKGRQCLEFRRGGFRVVHDAVMGEMEVPIKPLKVTSQELQQPFPVQGLPGRDGLARGILTPEEAARQIRRASVEFGAAADNLPKSDADLASWVVQKMGSHTSKGALFVEVADATEVPDGADLEEDLAPVGMASPEGVIVYDAERDRAYCQVCDKSFDKRGINGHRRSNKHQANMQTRDKELQQASGF